MSNYGPEKVTDNHKKLMMHFGMLPNPPPPKKTQLTWFCLFTSCLVCWSEYFNLIWRKSRPRWGYAHFESLFFVFHSQGNNYRKRLFIVFKPFRLSLSCILYSHKVPISDTSFGKCLESHASFNLATPLGWTSKCIKQRCCTFSEKCKLGSC